MSCSTALSHTKQLLDKCTVEKDSFSDEKLACHKSLSFLIDTRNGTDVQDFTRVLADSFNYQTWFHYSVCANVLLLSVFVLLLLVQCLWLSRKSLRKRFEEEKKLNVEIRTFARIGARVSDGKFIFDTFLPKWLLFVF